MLSDRIDPHWIDAFQQVFERCKLRRDERAIILCETHSRELNVQLAELALARIGCSYFHLRVPSPAHPGGPVIRSSGASRALTDQTGAVAALAAADFVVDLTVEGLMHSPETPAILKGGARILNISNEHPDALARLLPQDADKEAAKAAVARCRAAKIMQVTSPAGTDLSVDMQGAVNIGVWGWTDRPGTLAHWPAGIVVSFPRGGSVNGRLVFQPGDMNLTFKRYFDSQVIFDITADYVTDVGGNGLDARLMRDYLASFGDREAYATSHVGWGLNPGARYEALTMYDQREINGTELRAVAGNFLYSTGANELAGRYTDGHFDLPMMGCDIALDGELVVAGGKLVDGVGG